MDLYLIADAIDTMFSYIASKINEEEKPSSRLSVTPWLRTEDKDADRSKLRPIFGEWAEWPHEDRVQLFEEVLTNHELKYIYFTERNRFLGCALCGNASSFTYQNGLASNEKIVIDPFSNAYNWRTEGCHMKKTLQIWSALVLFLFLFPVIINYLPDGGASTSSKLIKEPA